MTATNTTTEKKEDKHVKNSVLDMTVHELLKSIDPIDANVIEQLILANDNEAQGEAIGHYFEARFYMSFKLNLLKNAAILWLKNNHETAKGEKIEKELVDEFSKNFSEAMNQTGLMSERLAELDALSASIIMQDDGKKKEKTKEKEDEKKSSSTKCGCNKCTTDCKDTRNNYKKQVRLSNGRFSSNKSKSKKSK